MRITRDELEQARAELEAALGDDPSAGVLEPLGRVHRWLDEREPAARRFREAADAAARALEHHGGEDADRIAQVGTLLWRASDGEAAMPWIGRALRAGPAPGVACALQYLAEDFDAAIATARDAAAEAIEALSIARRDEDGAFATRARETLAGLVHRRGTPPWEESGSPEMSPFDWFEEAALIEAWLHEQRQPDHAELLELLGG